MGSAIVGIAAVIAAIATLVGAATKSMTEYRQFTDWRRERSKELEEAAEAQEETAEELTAAYDDLQERLATEIAAVQVALESVVYQNERLDQAAGLVDAEAEAALSARLRGKRAALLARRDELGEEAEKARRVAVRAYEQRNEIEHIRAEPTIEPPSLWLYALAASSAAWLVFTIVRAVFFG